MEPRTVIQAGAGLAAGAAFVTALAVAANKKKHR